MQNLVVILTFSALDQKYLFWTNLLQKIKIVYVQIWYSWFFFRVVVLSNSEISQEISVAETWIFLEKLLLKHL